MAVANSRSDAMESGVRSVMASRSLSCRLFSVVAMVTTFSDFKTGRFNVFSSSRAALCDLCEFRLQFRQYCIEFLHKFCQFAVCDDERRQKTQYPFMRAVDDDASLHQFA